jgi:hypothetical protein
VGVLLLSQNMTFVLKITFIHDQITHRIDDYVGNQSFHVAGVKTVQWVASGSHLIRSQGA